MFATVEAMMWGISCMITGGVTVVAIMMVTRRTDAICPRCAFYESGGEMKGGHG
jgi:hypothetical protein